MKILRKTNFFGFRAKLIILSGIGLFALVIGTAMIQAQNPAADILGTLPVMIALDADEDGELSSGEVDNAPNTLVSLDADEDGMLSAGELAPEIETIGRGRRGRGGRGVGRGRGGRAGRAGRGGRPGRGGPGGGFGDAGILDTFPVMATLDADGDGALSAAEIADASAALIPLDADGDGKLVGGELVPAGGFGRGGLRAGLGGRRGPGGRGGVGRGGRGGDPNAVRLEPREVDSEDGTDSIPEHATFNELAYMGDEVLIDTHLTGLEFVKFVVTDVGTDETKIYFMNTKTHRAHGGFLQVAGLGGRGGPGYMMGVLVYRPLLTAPNGQPGLYTFEFEPFDSYPFDLVQIAYNLLSEYAPVVRGRLAYHPMPSAVDRYEDERDTYEAAELTVFLDEDLYTDIAFLPLNQAEGFGRLRLMELDERPGVRDVVLYRSLPNEMPRVAGIITAFRQTPLSHVNLRAVQDNVPNAYIKGVAENEEIRELIGRYVYYKVAPDGYEIREATIAEVDSHFADIRPSEPQIPVRDLSVTQIRTLDEIGFDDSTSTGVKAANVATLDTIGLPDAVVPDGFAVPFYFYDEFMKSNDSYERAVAMRGIADFGTDTEMRERELAAFRSEIEAGEMPDWMMDALDDLANGFPEGTSIRFRSSTNNEDLPGFSGAGLYDSFTHDPDEGHISKSIKQVFASLWNFRAYEESEFYRIDHFAAAMGVLAHPNYSDELANGVAVTEDIVYQTGNQLGGRSYYVNTQVGEDLVTNPEDESIPEEILLSPLNARNDRFVRSSNRVADGETLLGARHRTELRRHLTMIHNAFRRFYGLSQTDQFAMEIEFKITAEGVLAIKQARPWVY